MPKSRKCALRLYEATVKQFSLGFSATAKFNPDITIGIDSLEITNKVIELREKVDQARISMQDALKASYVGIVLDPCNSDRHFKLVESIQSKNADLLKLEAQLDYVLGSDDDGISTGENGRLVD